MIKNIVYDFFGNAEGLILVPVALAVKVAAYFGKCFEVKAVAHFDNDAFTCFAVNNIVKTDTLEVAFIENFKSGIADLLCNHRDISVHITAAGCSPVAFACIAAKGHELVADNNNFKVVTVVLNELLKIAIA